MRNWLRAAFLAMPVLTAASADCTYLDNPSSFLRTPEQRWREVSGWTEQVNAAKGSRLGAQRLDVADAPLPRRNLIDEYIFARMEREGIRPAPLSSDEEFLRRTYLDLTGRIPSPGELRAFLSDTNAA